jgi:hypothetical protein
VTRRARLGLAVAVAVAALAGCSLSRATPDSSPIPASTPPAASEIRAETVPAPAWRPGDRWAYVWTSGQDRGTRTIEVREVKAINGVRYYVVRNMEAEADQYWTMDLHWAGSVRESKVQARMVPPEPWFTWPLRVGQQWQHSGEFEQEGGKHRANDTFVVVALETVEVPAGTFEALKIVRTSTGGDSDQYWYVPEVRSYVRWIGRRGSVEFEERLSEYGGVRRGRPVSPEPPRPLR